MTATRPPKVTAAMKVAAARKAARTPAEVAAHDAILARTAHLFLCTPIECLAGGDKHRFHRDLAPAVGGDGCHCGGVPLKVVGPEFFLARDKAGA